MKKRIKLKIVHYLDKCYTVEYSIYYLFPFKWETIKADYPYVGLPELFSKEAAIYLCEKIKTIEDLKKLNLKTFWDEYVLINWENLK